MKTYEKAVKFLIFYVLGFALTLGFFIAWLILLMQTSGTETSDIILLSVMFGILFLGEFVFIGLYFKTPKEVLAFNSETVNIYLSKRKTKTFALRDISSFASTKRNLFVLTKQNTMTTVRFLANVKLVEAELRQSLNDYIVTQSDAYFHEEEHVQ